MSETETTEDEAPTLASIRAAALNALAEIIEALYCPREMADTESMPRMVWAIYDVMCEVTDPELIDEEADEENSQQE